jgi:predicted nucleic acid-binding Zn ribbon protein
VEPHRYCIPCLRGAAVSDNLPVCGGHNGVAALERCQRAETRQQLLKVINALHVSSNDLFYLYR